jgi:hypothetical protein
MTSSLLALATGTPNHWVGSHVVGSFVLVAIGAMFGVFVMAILVMARDANEESRTEAEWDAACENLRKPLPPDLRERMWTNIDARLPQ